MTVSPPAEAVESKPLLVACGLECVRLRAGCSGGSANRRISKSKVVRLAAEEPLLGKKSVKQCPESAKVRPLQKM